MAQCLCGTPITFGRSNVRRCPNRHSLHVRDYNGIWIYENTDPESGLGTSTMFIRKGRKSDYVRSIAEAAYENQMVRGKG